MSTRTLSAAVAVVLLCCVSFGTSIDLVLADKVRYCAVVAEVRIDAAQGRGDELVCQCSILRGFKVPIATNKLTLTFHYLQKDKSYVGKTFLVFAFDHASGFRPFGAQAGLIEKGSSYLDLLGGRRLTYEDLIRGVRALTEGRRSEPTGAANGSQPIRSETNRTSSAAGSRR